MTQEYAKILDDRKMQELNNNQKLILYSIGQIENGIYTKTHIQKLIFLTLKALNVNPERLGYYAHNFGPYSLTVEEISDDLERDGYLQNKNKAIVANDMVIDKINMIEPKSQFDRFKIKEIADFVDGLTRDEVLLHTYVRDPDFAKESKILDEVLSKRVQVAAGMYDRGKVTMSAGAELAGLSICDFRETVGKHRGVSSGDL